MLPFLLFFAILPTDNPAPWDTTVRIESQDSVCSGVIIQSDENATIALTCGHTWRGLETVQVHLFDGKLKGRRPTTVSYVEQFPGEVILINQMDYAYVRFRPGKVLPVSPIAENWIPQIDEKLTSSGSDQGNNPSFWTTQVQVVGRSWILCKYTPEPGRSGGGLFNSKQELVAICVGSKPTEKQGKYLRIKPPIPQKQ